jgi:hypothetical protein
MAAVAVDHRLQVHPAHALEVPHHEGIHRYQFAHAPGFNVPFPEFGVETLQKPNLLRLQLDLFPAHRLIQT